MVRGEVFHLPPRRGARGREQRGARYAVIVQADEFLELSTTLVAPTSASARPASCARWTRRSASSSASEAGDQYDATCVPAWAAGGPVNAGCVIPLLEA